MQGSTYAVEWILEDVQEEISVSQFGGLVGSSAVLVLVHLVHNWHKNMDSTGKIVRVSFLDFRRAYDLINHDILFENFVNIGVRPSLIRWFATYLQCSQWRRNRGGGGGGEAGAPPNFFMEGLSPLTQKKSVRRDFNHVNVVLDSVLEWLEC